MVDAAAPAKAEMLAAARKKLKDFEARQRLDGRNSPASSIISSEPGAGAGLNGRSSVVSEDSTALQIPHSSSSAQSLNARNGLDASPFQPNGNEWYQAYTQLKTQHDELCAHYSQLHSAYSQVNANGIHVDTENQIVQLQNALSAMVEEKVSSQSDLRQANKQIEKLRHKLAAAENIANQMSNSTSSGLSSNEIRKLNEAIAQKDSLLTARHQELEGARREVASMQANLLNVQHERSEAQARVKSMIKETAAQENRISQLMKDIQMKDLYLKQLGATGPPGGIPNENTNYENLQRELENVKAEKSRLLVESATLKAHYADREYALQQKQAEMALEIEHLHNQKFSSNDQVEHLENQLEIAQSELQKLQMNMDVSERHDEIPTITEEDVARRIREACFVERGKWERRSEDDQKRREEEILEKDKVIFEREQSLAELEMKYRLLEERTLESTANGADLLSLSEQLQNEKATVSRAVAQNKELKERLLETEDRFVTLTKEKADVELAKQSAEHQVRELTKQLNLETAGLVGNLSEVIARQPHLEASQESAASQEQREESQEIVKLNEELKENISTLQRENAEIRSDLELKTHELQLVRADLRRSNTHNEQMDEIMRQNAEDENQNSIHVELTQAVGRVQDLHAENEALREAFNNCRQQLEDERADRRAEEERKDLESKQEQLELKETKVPEEAENQQSSRELHEDLWARKELEKRFARAMLQNAELVETIDRLEHINQQLELENDTIADHVVLYQHQRKLVRERLRVKDEQLKAMEEDRTKTVARCQELQNVLMTVLNKGGVLKEYQTSSISRKAARRVSRSYSHSTVDEMSGDEDVLVDAKLEEVPEREKVHGNSDDEKIPSTPPPTVLEAQNSPRLSDCSADKDNSDTFGQTQDASVRRILEIISDISRPQILPAGQLHCTQCIGDLQEL
ncbi:Golgin subfamily A conserved domain-containing protein [Caenorhabditis elegans]|uniref:Golgin subfamily A conserved domain-containing protein n=1 Tax=Caenorhabditis elegans TaxID=6239 RepID=Q19989_CAEEL|nr:Golgin subfamily A conserved domain-containing protein [Caenorhabditis elegans]CCD65794.1 Golgin subfamily A conserved domain-containing protein [Caenorhabditis elegans]|eukprot:NP_494929.3 GOLGi associated coiled-coil protein homolog [Caenorhabditis elegans]